MQAYCIDTDDVPKPGHPQATAMGCTCPIMDNHSGRGRGGEGDKYGWYISQGCPVHASESKEQSDG